LTVVSALCLGTNLTLNYFTADLPDDPNFPAGNAQMISFDATGAMISYMTMLDPTHQAVTAAVSGLAPTYSLAVVGPFTQSLVELPVVLADQVFHTNALVEAGSAAAHLTVTGYGPDGSMLPNSPVTITTAANHQLLESVNSLGFTATNADGGWVELPSDVNTIAGVETIGNGSRWPRRSYQ
jgi:hypothetical protein